MPNHAKLENMPNYKACQSTTKYKNMPNHAKIRSSGEGISRPRGGQFWGGGCNCNISATKKLCSHNFAHILPKIHHLEAEFGHGEIHSQKLFRNGQWFALILFCWRSACVLLWRGGLHLVIIHTCIHIIAKFKPPRQGSADRHCTSF